MPLTITDLDQFKANPVDVNYQSDMRRFYAPYDDVHGLLLCMADEVRTSSVLSMFGFTDKELAAKIDGHLRDPQVFNQFTLDAIQLSGPTEHALLLAQYHWDLEGNSVAYGHSEFGKIIHKKMWIINGVWLITGSTNWSMDGETKQDNELTVTYNAVACAEARHLLDLGHTKALKDMAAKAAKS